MSFPSDFTKCSKIGDCKTNNNDLVPGFQLFTNPITNSTYSETVFKEKSLFSKEDFEDLIKKDYIKNTKLNYTCADGFEECMFTCCTDGKCIYAKNICSVYINDKNRIIFISLIIFSIFCILYWGIFVYIGLKYSKKKRIVRNFNEVGLDFVGIGNKKQISSQEVNVNRESNEKEKKKVNFEEGGDEINGRIIGNERRDVLTSNRELNVYPTIKGSIQILE